MKKRGTVHCLSRRGPVKANGFDCGLLGALQHLMQSQNVPEWYGLQQIKNVFHHLQFLVWTLVLFGKSRVTRGECVKFVFVYTTCHRCI